MRPELGVSQGKKGDNRRMTLESLRSRSRIEFLSYIIIKITGGFLGPGRSIGKPAERRGALMIMIMIMESAVRTHLR